VLAAVEKHHRQPVAELDAQPGIEPELGPSSTSRAAVRSHSEHPCLVSNTTCERLTAFSIGNRG
jgi:hypothetical protein